MQQKYFSYFFVFSLILVFIAPFLYVTSFTYLSADDFCRATTNVEDYWENIREWYVSHNGRYTNAFLSYLPVYNLQTYRLTLGISMMILGLAIFMFVRSIFLFFRLRISKLKTTLFAVLFYVVLISQLPSVFEFFYWYAGATVYMYSIIFFLLFLACILGFDLKNNTNTIVAGVLIVLINGNSEMLILLMNFLLLVYLVWCFAREKRLWKRILVLNFLSWISSIAVIFAPGSTSRQGQYPEGGDVAHSIISSFLSTGMFFLKSVIEFPYVIFYLGTILFVWFYSPYSGGKTIKYIKPSGLLMFSFVGFVLVLFVPYYATGYLNVNRGRIGNIVHVLFWILLFFNLINASQYLRTKVSSNRNVGWLPLGILSVFIIVLIPYSTNYQNLISDIRNNRFQEFEENMAKRHNLLKTSTEEGLRIKKIPGTITVRNYGVSSDEHHWTNECFTEMINRVYDKEYKYIVVE